jgi:spore coat protein A, manganese oxidase
MAQSQLLLLVVVAGLSLLLDPQHGGGTLAAAFAEGLMDPSTQPKFVEDVPEALAEEFKIYLTEDVVQEINTYRIWQETGLVDPSTGERLVTPLLGYGTSAQTASWPGPTLEVQQGTYSMVQWGNELLTPGNNDFPFTSLDGQSVVDTSLHWAFSLPGYESYSIEADGIPTVTHVHGSRSGPDMDGNPEHFFTTGYAIRGPEWKLAVYKYPNRQPATMLWYHDHTLGITRLNNYAGLQGFYFIRDDMDTGKEDNALGLPFGDFEKAYAIQDRFFKENGELFYPAYKGEPFYDDYITGEGADWDSDVDGPTALAEFFGDHMVVNGKIWPRQRVSPNRFRLRLLNGCDSRFLIVQFRAETQPGCACGPPIPYTLVGTDQGLLEEPIHGLTESLIETGARHDIVMDFSGYEGQRIVMVNNGGDTPFTGERPVEQLFNYTDLVMSFDVNLEMQDERSDSPSWYLPPDDLSDVARIRRVGLFEGKDNFGRLQPLLGGEKEANIVETWTWSEPTTEFPVLHTIEEWEIFNFSGDAHPIHLHLVGFYVMARYAIAFDSNADAENMCGNNTDYVALDGTCCYKLA